MKIFDLLDEFDLDKPKNRIKNLLNLSPNDLDKLIDLLSEAFTEKETVLSEKQEKNVWELWLPFFSYATLDQIPSYLFAFDKVCILDPLVDYLYELQYTDTSPIEKISKLIEKNETLPEIARLIKPDVASRLAQSFDQATWNMKVKEISAQKIDRVINYYLKYRELIQENAFIPYVDLRSDYSGCAVTMLYMIENLVNEFLEKYSLIPVKVETKNDLQEAVNSLESVISVFWKEYFEAVHFMPAALNFKSTFPSSAYSNITFGDDKNRALLDSLITLLSKSLKNEKIKNIKWPSSNDEIIFPSLSGVPPENLLRIRQKEKEAFEKYRYYTQKKLLEMKAVAGTKEYVPLIKSFQVEQKAQTAEISLLYKNIKNNLRRNIAHHISSVTLSAAATILAAISTISDPFTLLGIGFGSSGTMIGIEKLIDDWITFQSEKDKLKEKDAYVLWRAFQ